MTLVDTQTIFTRNLAHLIDFIDSQLKYKFSLREVQRTKEQALLYAKEGKGVINSLHCDSLAADIMLFDVSNGKFLTESEHYKLAGDYWESLDTRNRWGGYFKKLNDPYHFSLSNDGIRA